MQVFERQLSRAMALILTASCICVGQNASAPQFGVSAPGREAQELYTAQRYVEAKDRATAGAAEGDAASMYVLGEIYSSGKGASKSDAESASWMTKAATASYAPAMNALGNLYETGAGVPKDYAKAAEWYQKGAKAGFAAAMTSLGLMYENGRVATQTGEPGEPDFGEALSWYKKAASRGDAHGMYLLALCYDVGKGMAPDQAMAREWYRNAAAEGWSEAIARQGQAAALSQSESTSPPPATVPLISKGPCAGATRQDRISGQGISITEVATKLRARGEVDVKFTIETDGRARDIELIAPFGYGLEERALQAIPEWRFRPSVKDGLAMACPAQAGFTFGQSNQDTWYSGRMLFYSEAGLTAPVVRDGSMPKPGGESPSNESISLDFTVDATGAVKDIVNGDGAAAYLARYLKTWKFQPAVEDGHAVEATGRVWFIKGKGNGAENRQTSPPPPSRSAAAAGGVTLTPSDPDVMEKMAKSIHNRTPALIEFVNRSGIPVDIYWINYEGNREKSAEGVQPGATFQVRTFLTHPFLIVASGSGGTTARNSGRRLAAFQAVTENSSLDAAKRDIAIITNPVTTAGPAAPQTSPRRIRTMLNPQDNQVYIWIPPGSFTKGCSQGDAECGNNEKPSRVEQVDSGFWMGQTEVTQAAYKALIGTNPSSHKGDRLPVESVTWTEAVSYCASAGGRLPTDTEWEYAARAGTTEARYGNLDAIAWNAGNSGAMTHPVAEKQPNAFGLYDMLGNVWEWVQDPYPGTAQRILRGGSLFMAIPATRASTKIPGDVQARFNGRGFRCAGQWPAPQDAAPSETAAAPPPAPAPPAPNPVRPRVAPGTAGPDGVYYVGNGVAAPSILRKFDPEYSEEARKAKLAGVVVVQVVINAKGMVENPKVMKGLGKGLDEKAIEAVRKWRFDPGRKDGKPVPVLATVEVNFQLL